MTHQRQQIKLADHVLSTLHNFTIRYSILLKDVRFDAIPELRMVFTIFFSFVWPIPFKIFENEKCRCPLHYEKL